MSLPVIICDDSTMARKQMARALPGAFDVDLSFAEHGQDALELIRQGKGHLMFLDLNMPVLDGYQTLAAIRQENLDCLVVVVSGDIQPDAQRRVSELGAIGFIQKPSKPEIIEELLNSLGFMGQEQRAESAAATHVETITQRAESAHAGAIGLREGMQEVANVAMGQSGDLLARLLGEFILLPLPKVNLLEPGELQMALSFSQHETCSAVCQGFIGSGIAGEALLIFTDSSFPDMARLLKHSGDITREVELELLMDVASILTGSCIKGVGEQLDVNFSQGHPMVLGQHLDVGSLIKTNASRWTQTLAIEIPYRIENFNISCELLLLFTEDSFATIQDRLDILLSH